MLNEITKGEKYIKIDKVREEIIYWDRFGIMPEGPYESIILAKKPKKHIFYITIQGQEFKVEVDHGRFINQEAPFLIFLDENEREKCLEELDQALQDTAYERDMLRDKIKELENMV